MAYGTQCEDAGLRYNKVLRFSNPRQQHGGDPLGVPQQPANRSVDGPVDAVAVLNATGPAVGVAARSAGRREPAAGAGGQAAAVADRAERRLCDRECCGGARDPDADPLGYGATTSAPQVAAVSGSRVTVTPVSDGAATIRVTATDPGGLSAAQTFAVTVGSAVRAFTDHPLVRGVTPIRAAHVTELRERIDALRAAAGLARFGWTGPVITAGVTPVRREHLTEAAFGADRGVCDGGADGVALDGCGAGGRSDADPGGARDGAAHRSYYERSLPSVAAAVLVVAGYGGMIAGVLPQDDRVSWEAHLFGLLAGGQCARLVPARRR